MVKYTTATSALLPGCAEQILSTLSEGLSNISEGTLAAARSAHTNPEYQSTPHTTHQLYDRPVIKEMQR